MKKEFEKKVYLPLRREISYSGYLFFSVGIGIIIWGHIAELALIPISVMCIGVGAAFFFRRWHLDKGFYSKKPIYRFNLVAIISDRLNRLECLQKIYFSSKRAKKIEIMKKWLEHAI